LHTSQRIVKDDKNGLVISLKLIVNYELISVLLSYCPDVSVLQPSTLADKLDELLKKGREVNRRSNQYNR
jgi:predicted DNA-binding transcriptional regulator YafY